MILLTGATGNTGGEAAKHLAAAKAPFRVLIRNPDKAGPLEELGAEIAIGDFGDAEALRQALAGVDKAYLVTPNEEDQPQWERQFIELAQEAGVKHIVYLSSMESVPGATTQVTQAHVAAEQQLRDSGLTWTMIRPTFFNQLLLSTARGVKAKDAIVFPLGSGRLVTTDVRDIGEVIAKVLTEPGHENQSYDITGPDLVTMTEVAEKFSKVLGRQIDYVDQPIEEFAGILRMIGMKDWRVDAVCEELAMIAAGSLEHRTDTIEKLLGRPPISLDQFISDYKAAFE
ncbi:MAG: SDR family oxidoreductase [Gammaproteobacteria bacterium]|nr:SDR family oxidoreductase [Gammaproteobacteria bacterium]